MRLAAWFLCLVLWSGLVVARPILEVDPPAAATVQEERPVIQVSWPAGSLAGARSRLWLNGYEVTSDCLRNADFLSYRPFSAPAAGPVQMRFLGQDAAGAPVEHTWSFTLLQPKLIRQVSHNAANDLWEGDDLVVDCEARPGGKAQALVANWPPIPLAEVKPGQYRGVYRVHTRDTALQQPLRVVFQSSAGAREQEQAAVPVRIFGGFYRVRVLEPADGSQVEQSFTIVGRAKPGSRVSIIPKIGFNNDQAPTTGSDRIGPTAGSIPAEVDAEGNFRVEYGVPILIPGMKVVMSVFGVDAEGTRSMPTVVRYTFK